jgi:hypothetical protein
MPLRRGYQVRGTEEEVLGGEGVGMKFDTQHVTLITNTFANYGLAEG